MLGAALVRKARSRGIDVVALGGSSVLREPGVRSLRSDLTDTTALISIVSEVRPRWVLHCAAATDVDRCEEHPDEAMRVNADGSANVARAAKAASAGLVYISTDSVFDGRRGGYTEEDTTGPVNEYSRSKLAGEEAVRAAGLDRWIVARTTIYGWSPHGRPSVAEWFLSRIEASQPTNGFADVVFSPILVQDLSDALLDLIDLDVSGIFHVAGREACTKYEFGRRVAAEFGLDPRFIRPVPFASAKLRAPRPLDTSLSVAKVTRVLGRQMPDVTDGLRGFRRLREVGEAAQLKAIRRSQGADVQDR